MLIAMDRVALDSCGAAPVESGRLLECYEAQGRYLENSQHSPRALDDLLALDTHLEQHGYPQGFRYAKLALAGPPVPVVPKEDYPMLGWIAYEDLVAAAGMRRDWLDGIDDESAACTLEELLDAADAAVAARRCLAGVYG